MALQKKHILRVLDPIHHQGLRITLGAFRTLSIKSLYAEAGEPSLEHRRTKLAFNYTLKLKSLPRNPCHDIVFEAPLHDFSADSKSEPNLVASTFEHYGSKLEEKVEAAAYYPERPDCSKTTRLRDGASVFSAELEGIALALTEIKNLTKYHKNFVIYNDSLSALHAIQSKIFKVKDIRRLYNLIRKFPPNVHISFVWNENLDKLVKAALNRASC
ncbi:RNA-directed DNA polymerase from mobile element jockey [Plakobranchus ocellatus]|uniref:RNA-directed DNA polymerase from mobile element jockey n=1 Tax=Plakobranchus ocellatus TaxID=259542 RepID=A0AAV3YZ42_9GAST|nr:RNA-directed DNA polymerase from mobile element jockey [Plakobranchus ocellatus]